MGPVSLAIFREADAANSLKVTQRLNCNDSGYFENSSMYEESEIQYLRMDLSRKDEVEIYSTICLILDSLGLETELFIWS